jgi:hypothetical protein
MALLITLIIHATGCRTQAVPARDGTSSNLDNTHNRMQNPKVKEINYPSIILLMYVPTIDVSLSHLTRFSPAFHGVQFWGVCVIFGL